MATGAARQWTFVPRARARDATALVAASLCIAGYPVLVPTGAWWSSTVILVASVVALVVGRGPVTRSDGVAVEPESDEECSVASDR
jgi:fatty acid desaturase